MTLPEFSGGNIIKVIHYEEHEEKIEACFSMPSLSSYPLG